AQRAEMRVDARRQRMRNRMPEDGEVFRLGIRVHGTLRQSDAQASRDAGLCHRLRAMIDASVFPNVYSWTRITRMQVKERGFTRIGRDLSFFVFAYPRMDP